MKKLACLFLAVIMVLGLMTGCGSKPADTSAAQSGEAAPAGEAYPTEIDMTEEPYEVAIQVVVLPGTDYSALETVMEEKANAITVPAINAKLDIQFVWISEVANTTSMAVAGDEKIDLVHVATVNPLSALVGSDLLLDMNEGDLLQNRGGKIVELQKDILKTGFVSDKQLAVPAIIFNATAQGIYYNKTMSDAAGVTVPEKGDIDDIEAALYAMKEANPDVWPYYVGNGQLNFLYWLVGYEGFGQECSYGAVLDKNSASPVVENIYASEMFKDYCLRMYKWRQDGIIGSDSTNNEPAQNYIGANALFCTPATLNQYLFANYGSTGVANGQEIGFMLTTDYSISNAAVTEYMWGIASNCKRPDKAMDMLNLIYSDAELANLLLYGVEEENYFFVDDTKTVIAPNGSYLPLFYRAGNTSEMLIQAPAGADYIELTQKDEDSATISKLVDYMFDDSEFQAESSAIYSTIMQYLPTLQNGMCESEEATLALIDEFVAKLEASGINDVIAGNQAQIDAHLAG